MFPNFKHKSPAYIRFCDIDAFGHVNNAIYLTLFEQARFHYFNDVVKIDVQWSKQGIILAKADVDFVSPIVINDRVHIYTRCSKIGTKSFTLEYIAVREKNGDEEIVARSFSILVAFDYEINASMAVPESWKNEFLSFEGSI